MLDIGFSEIFLIVVILLIVVGPEKMPRIAYLAGKWVGKAKGMINSVKTEIDKEVKAEELKEILEKQKAIANPLEEIIEETNDSLMDAKMRTEESLVESPLASEKSPS